MNSIDLIRPQLKRLQSLALPVGGIGLLLPVVGFFIGLRGEHGPQMFLASYLVAYMLVFGVTMGSLAFLLIHHVAGSGALFLARRLLEAGAKNLPLMALFFVPILLGVLKPDWHFYPWADYEGHVRGDEVLSSKEMYLNVPFWLGRTVFYFASWIGTLFMVLKWSRLQEKGDTWATHKLAMWGSAFLLLYVMTMTFAAFDWVMSLTPHWFSSLFGVIFIVGQGLSTLCLMHVLITYLTKNTNLTDWVPQRYFRDLGNLTLAFTLLWAYTNFSQYVIIWSGNIGEEAEWYLPRIQANWVLIGGFIIAFHFAVPFLSLLSSSLKVRIQNLAKLAILILFLRFLDMNFYIVATFAPNVFGNTFANNGTAGPNLGAVNWLAAIGAPLGLAGTWLFFWAKNLMSAPDLISTTDPRFVGQFEVPPAPDAKPAVGHGGAVAHG